VRKAGFVQGPRRATNVAAPGPSTTRESRARRFGPRAEFRRKDRAAPWILAGVWIRDEFYPAAPGVEPVRGRLPGPGLVGWVDLGLVLARSPEQAAEISLQLAAGRWPGSHRDTVPHA
jgi:hypothetical protein